MTPHLFVRRATLRLSKRRALDQARTITTLREASAREIIDSRGFPTLEVSVTTLTGNTFVASVPSGKSTGIHEAAELRDGGSRFFGKGVTKAVASVSEHLGPALVRAKISICDQAAVDNFMLALDGTLNCSRFGANAMIGMSLAIARAGAYSQGVTLYNYVAALAGRDSTRMVLPVPSFNVINGGSHAGNKIAVQEFMILPTGAESFKEAVRIACEVYHTLRGLIQKRYGLNAVNVGDEGGFAPPINTTEEVLDILMLAIKEAGYQGKVHLGMDIAAAQWYDKERGQYDQNFKSAPPNWLTSERMVEQWAKLVEEARYPMLFLEDPLSEDDWSGFSQLTARVGSQCQIVGDDLLVTNVSRVRIGLERNACNAMLVKPNQIGTVTGTIAAVTLCQKNKWGLMMSHRSGETGDDYIADLAVGLGCQKIKSGATARYERLAKYNRLMKIEEELGERAIYQGKLPLDRVLQ